MTLKGYTAAGIRSGRQRYAPEIQGGILNAQEAAGISRLAELDAEEQSLILQAKMAADDKQFEILQAKSENMIKIQEQKMQTILDLNNLAYQEEERMRARMEFNRNKASWAKEDAGTRLESMITGGIDLNSLSDEEYLKLESDLGLMEGTLEGFYVGLQEAQAAEAMGDEIKLQQSIISLLNSTSQGMEVTIGDKTYSGLKDTTERMSYTYTDAANNKKYEVVIDKKTGEELYRKDMGQAYKYTDGGDDDDKFDLKANKSKIEQYFYGKTGEDGKVSPDDYNIAKAAWLEDGGTEDSFEANFYKFKNPENQYYN